LPHLRSRPILTTRPIVRFSKPTIYYLQRFPAKAREPSPSRHFIPRRLGNHLCRWLFRADPIYY